MAFRWWLHIEHIDPSATDLDEVRVLGQAEGQSKAFLDQRVAVNIKNIVSAEQIVQFPDMNAAEVMQRIPGITVQRDQGEGRFIGIRGIDPNLNVTTINGLYVPSPESGARSVALDVIPSDLLASLEISKTFTPEELATAFPLFADLSPEQRFQRDYFVSRIDHDLFWRVKARWPFRNPEFYFGWLSDSLDPAPYITLDYAPVEEHMAAFTRYLEALPEAARASPSIAPLRAHLEFITAAGVVEDPDGLQQQIAMDPDDCRSRFRLAAVSLIEDDYATAVAELVEILRRDRQFDDGIARRGLLAVFETLGGDHELVKRYRGEMARLIH